MLFASYCQSLNLSKGVNDIWGPVRHEMHERAPGVLGHRCDNFHSGYKPSEIGVKAVEEGQHGIHLKDWKLFSLRRLGLSLESRVLLMRNSGEQIPCSFGQFLRINIYFLASYPNYEWTFHWKFNQSVQTFTEPSGHISFVLG
jgi:hypothetical protein